MKIVLCVDDDPVLDAVLLSLESYVELSNWDEVVLAHVVSPHPLFLVGADVPPMTAARAFLSRVASRLEHLPSSVEPLVVRGEPAQEIARVADEAAADLIVMGALGERRDFLMGSVSQKVVAMADVDVLVARGAGDGEAGARREPPARFRALVALDGSLGSEAGLDAFTRKLRVKRARIHLIHVSESTPSLWPVGFTVSFAQQAQEVLARARRLLEHRGLEAECEWRQGSPAGQILDVAREDGTDVIVIGSRGHSGIRGRVLGGITQRILRHAPCSVFCARAWAPESAELPSGWSSEEWEPGVGLA